MDWNITANVVVRSANRALELLIAKRKSLDGMPYDITPNYSTHWCGQSQHIELPYGVHVNFLA